MLVYHAKLFVVSENYKQPILNCGFRHFVTARFYQKHNLFLFLPFKINKKCQRLNSLTGIKIVIPESPCWCKKGEMADFLVKTQVAAGLFILIKKLQKINRIWETRNNNAL